MNPCRTDELKWRRSADSQVREFRGPGDNIEHRTSNAERRTERELRLPFGVRSSMFDVRCSLSAGLLGFFLLGAPLAPAQPTNPPAPVSLEEISQAMTNAGTVFTRFVQERHLSLFDEPLRTEGYLCFQKPGRVRWEITRPYRSILVSDGAGVAQFEWTDEKWKPLDLGLADALQNVVGQIAGVMEGRYASDRRSYVAAVTNSAEGPVITLTPQNEAVRKMMAAIEVHLAADLKATRRVVLRETGGDYTDIRFSEQAVGVALPPKTFDRTAPADLEQIRAAAAERK
jgi:outer membrane lipoprotein-sorting protein